LLLAFQGTRYRVFRAVPERAGGIAIPEKIEAAAPAVPAWYPADPHAPSVRYGQRAQVDRSRRLLEPEPVLGTGIRIKTGFDRIDRLLNEIVNIFEEYTSSISRRPYRE
jgi:hypothetical protein